MAKLRIVHVSDLHLFVEKDGAKRSIGELNRIVAWALRHRGLPLVGGFSVHDGKALTALRKAITELIDTSGVPVLLIQSGDVSTFGARRQNGSTTFPEWEFWAGERHQVRITQPVGWVDLYGNHDVWPGTLPLFGLASVEHARNELRAQHHRDQLPQRFAFPVGQDLLEVYTLNTVQHTAVANTLAEGQFEFDHPDLTAPPTYPGGTSDPLEHIRDLVAAHRPADSAVRVLRVLVMHHPPELFGAPPGALSAWWMGLKSGRLKNAATLIGWLQSQQHRGDPIGLVVAGHRHLIDPQAGKRPQPLGTSASVQLVCGTPTQERTSAAEPEHSFSVYDVDFGATIAVTRTIYERPATARGFRPAGGAVPMI